MVERTPWRTATVVSAEMETPTARRIVLDVPGWPGNDAGSHLDVRLTAPDGYQASRSYSLASSGPGERVTLAVDELPDGEVSPFLVHELRAGDELEVRGPLGAFFVWHPMASSAPGQPGGHPGSGQPVQLIAGGSGVVPLYAIAAAHAAAGDPSEFRLLYSVRSPEMALFASDLATMPGLRLDWVYTRVAPDGWSGPVGRLTQDALASAAIPPAQHPRVYVCGSNPFAESVTGWLLDLGYDRDEIRIERYGG